MGMGGIQRVYNIPRNLKKIGWDINVYTPYPPSGYPRGENLPSEDNLNVIRFFSPDPLHLLPGSVSKPGSGKRDYLSFPDNKVPCLPFLWKNLKTADVVVTSSPPFSLLLTGFKIKNTPWVIDYRDPWTGSYLGRYLFRWEENLAKAVEKYCIHKSSAVVTVTEKIMEYLTHQYPEDREKIHLIRNGYDGDDFPKSFKREKDNNTVITYMGTFNNLVTSDLIFEAFRELFKIKPDIKDNIVFKHIGYSSVGGLDRRANKVELKKFISTGYLPHKEALSELMDSDILLLLGGKRDEGNWIVTGKIYEYLRSGLPIVAVTNNKEIQNLVNSSGLIIDFEPESIARGILKVILNPDSFKPVSNYQDYSWENLSRKYANLLSSVL